MSKIPQLFDLIIERHGLKNDGALARALDMTPGWVSKTRNEKLKLCATGILAIHEFSGMPVKEIKSYLPGAA